MKSSQSCAPERTDRNSRPSVSVALCTYNGRRYIADQLRSIAVQTHLPAELIVSDDGSCDGTIECVEEFRLTAPFPVHVSRNQQRLGVVKNFQQAMYRCEGEYIALSDQDDIWEANKIETCVQALRQAEDRVGVATPILVHTDLTVVDQEGRRISDSFFRRRGFRPLHPEPIKELVLQNFVTGCTTLFNRPLLNLALPFPEGTSMHDWWIALVAASSGLVVTLNDATVGYRMHGDNVIGAKKIEWRSYLSRKKAERLFRRALNESEGVLVRLNERNVQSSRTDFLANYHSAVRGGGLGKSLLLGKTGVRLQNAIPTWAFLVHVANGLLKN